MAPEQSEDTTKGLKAINFVVPCALKSNLFSHTHVLVPVAAAVTTKHRENVLVISSNKILCPWSCPLLYIILEAGIY